MPWIGEEGGVTRHLSFAPVAVLATAVLALSSLSGADRKVAQFAWRQCDQQHPRVCIRAAARKHNQPVSYAINVATCESRLNPLAIGGGIHFGLFQFLRSTFNTTPHAGRNIFSARWNSMAAMWVWENRGTSEWACA